MNLLNTQMDFCTETSCPTTQDQRRYTAQQMMLSFEVNNISVYVCVLVSNNEVNRSLPVCYVKGQMGDNDKSLSTDLNKNTFSLNISVLVSPPAVCNSVPKPGVLVQTVSSHISKMSLTNWKNNKKVFHLLFHSEGECADCSLGL